MSTVEIIVKCTCGQALPAEWKCNEATGALYLVVEPCEACLDDARRDAAEAHRYG